MQNTNEVKNIYINNDTKMDQYSSSWSIKHRWFYIFSIIFILASLLIWTMWPIIFPVPTCFDNKQNGLERNVDCGGACELVCKVDFVPLENTFAKAFKNGQNKYDILVILENKNKNMAPKDLSVDIEVYNDAGDLEKTLNKKLQASSYKKIPIFIRDFETVNGVSKIFVKINDYKSYITKGAYDVRLVDFNYKQEDVSKLSLKYSSPYKENINDDIEIVVLLKDGLENIVGVNSQKIQGLSSEIEKEVYFSWRENLSLDIKSVEIVPVSYLFYK
jgi:hypothetical protein